MLVAPMKYFLLHIWRGVKGEYRRDTAFKKRNSGVVGSGEGGGGG